MFGAFKKRMLKSCSVLLLGMTHLTVSYLPANSSDPNMMPLQIAPTPTPRPANLGKGVQKIDSTAVSSVKPLGYKSEQSKPISGIRTAQVIPIRGSLKDGLKAVSEKNINRALSIRAGMPAGSLDRKLLAWSIAMSGHKDVTSGEISKIAGDLPHWPGQKTMRKNAEAALARENLTAQQIVSAFGNTSPESFKGAVELAAAHISLGNRKAARSAIGPFWRTNRLSSTEEKEVLSRTRSALSKWDHQQRMHMLFYRDRVKSASKLSGYAEQASLAKARAAVIRKQRDASSLISKVAPSSQADPAYLFTRIEHARRTDDYKKAAKLLLKAPKDRSKLVNAHEWWVEQRIVARGLLDLGDARTAYKITAKHLGESRRDRAEGEFHAGWIALRFLNDARTARKHFAKILKISSTPISQARAYYWLGRASKGSEARKYYRSAAVHPGTFYGQLASQKVGVRRLSIKKPRPSSSERSKFANRELVKAITRLEEVGYTKRTSNFYYALAEKLNSSGEMALLSARAERQGKPSLALRIGKQAYYRGLNVDTLAWPIGAIPSSAKIGLTGKAMAYAIARQESEFNKAAVSPANARGLLQLLPGTAKDMARAKGLKYSYSRLTTDAAYNATLGAAYLSKQLDNFDNSYILTIAGYNAGPRRSREWVARYGDPRGKSIDYVVDWIERIPFTETRNYVMRVMENYTVYKTRLGGSKLNLERDLRFGRS